MRQAQLEGLKWTVKHVYEDSEFNMMRFDEHGVIPSDIRSLDDISKLPFTVTDDLRAGISLSLKVGAVRKDRPYPCLVGNHWKEEGFELHVKGYI